MDLPPEITWNEAVKKRINDAVVEEVGRIRICQKVFPTRHLAGSPLDVPDDAVDLTNLPNIRVREGRTKRLVELNFQFPITVAQAMNEPQSMTCQTLSRMAAKTIALAEDMIIFQGDVADARVRAMGVEPSQLGSARTGLLGAAAAEDDRRGDKPIPVPRLSTNPPPIYGQNVFKAVADGIAKLVDRGQAPNYALFLPTLVYADTFVSPGNQSLATTAERIRPLVEGGFYGTGTLPQDQGLLVALGGHPTVLYMGKEAETEYTHRVRSEYFFSVTERIQFVAVDPGALVLLQIELPP